jgi:glutaredoxin
MKGLEHKILKLDKDYQLEELQQLTGKQRMSMPVIVLADQTVTDVSGLAASLKR